MGTESSSEFELVEALRRRDERAFTELVDRHGAAMLRIARAYQRDRAVSEEIVQDAWVGVLKGIDRFEGRSSLRTWLLRIVANIAKTRAAREARTVPFSGLAAAEVSEKRASVAPERFQRPDEPFPGHWSSPPRQWNRPDDDLLSSETRDRIGAAIDELPASQRVVITLRDVEGWSAVEVSRFLDISEINQRVLLHRARSRVRNALDEYLTAELRRTQ
jgi:RNA polymerase sigma-70 factor (ECF subfamily)